ncbi:MAG: 4-coumarate--CoA ligase [Sneathiella sp.]|uniref:class I adenylate-forming enzyme family protein n=1 Tax=Sneathiella sp. TaxID=1964365 RepID=UPI000C4D36F4|nr:class I adenylate-forming enzyme family protein [Sneathiella sp.]MAZ04056.1 4-coumarate--CoA ligase [Sneathiella sp.]
MSQTIPAPGSSGDFLHYAARIREVAAANPSLEVIKCEGEVRTWAEFLPRTNRVANMLHARGLGRGDMVAVLARSSIEYLEVFLGALQAGLCIVPLSGMASSEQLEVMIRDSGSKLVFASGSTRDLIEPFRGKIEGVPADGYVAFDFAGSGWKAYEDLIRDASADPLYVDVQPEDGFNLIYSSGTTGVPKGIEQSQRMRSQHVIRFEGLGVHSKAVTLVSTALYSNTTLVALLPTLALGGRIIVMPKFDVVKFLEIAEQEKVTHAMLVPVQYQRILTHPDFDTYDLSSFEVKLSTSAPLREGVKRDIITRWPGKMIEIYGLTEGGIGTALSCTEFPDKLASVGRPGEGVELRLINEQGEELAPGEIGEIVGRSDAMMTGYHGRQDLTEAMIWRSPEGKVFFKSGDMGKFDEDGFLFLLDRKKDMIISGGFNIYAADIEAELSNHPDVADVAVIGIPSEEWGETPLALVVVKPGAEITQAGLKDWVNERLGKTQRISGVEFRDELPRSTIGKIMKRELREPYWKDAPS